MNALKEIVFEDFSSAAVIENFRICADGTLIKRDGFTVLEDFGETIRGCCFDGKETMYIVAGSELWIYNGVLVSNAGILEDSVFSSDDEKCIMYMYAGILYIIGGGTYYRYNAAVGSLEKTVFYAPVISSDADSYPKEQLNLMTARVRAVLSLSSASHTIAIRPEPLELHAVILDGVYLTEDQYSCTYNYSNCYVKITDTDLITENSTFIVEYSIAQSKYEPILANSDICTGAYVFEGKSGTRVLLYTEGEDIIYYSEPKNDALGNLYIDHYFPEGNKFVVGDGSEKILTITRQGERILVITQKAIYYIVEDADTVDETQVLRGFHNVLISDELGISKNSGAVIYDDEVYLMNSLGLYRLSFNPIDLKYTTTLIDIPDNVGLSKSSFADARLHIDRINRELWCQNGSMTAVYSLTNKKWYRFSGFNPSTFFTYKNATAFTEGTRICVFTVGETLDGYEGFDAFVQTRNLDLGNIFAEKTIYGFGAAFERRDGAVLECTLKSDKGDVFSFSVNSDDNTADTTPIVTRTHARLGNCYYIICKLTSPGYAAPANVRKMMLSYRVLGGAK